MIRVLVVSGSSVVRAGLEALIRESPALTLAGAAASLPAAQSLLDRTEEPQPDVILIERETDEEDPVTDLAAIEGNGDNRTSPAPGIVFLAEDPPAAWIAETLRAGARAVLPRDASAAEIIAAIQAAAADLVVMRPEMLETLLGESTAGAASALLGTGAPSRTNPEAESLTPRELQILGMLAQGLGNKEIAWRLNISGHTVKFHLTSTFGKLGVSTRTEAVMQGLRRGLIML